MFDVPYSSVGLEISPHLHERTDVASMRALFQVIGALLAATLPLVLKLTGIDALQAITTVMIGLAIFGLIAFWFLVPVRKTTETATRKSIITALRTAFSQPAYRQMITAFMLVQVANAFPAALMVLFIINVIGMPELINIALPLLILSSALFLPLWMFLSRLIGKRRTWMVSIMFCCAMLCFVPFLGAGDQWPLIAICIGLGAVFGCDTIMPTSILADIVYRTDQKSDGNFGGTFLAAKNSVSKLAFVAPLLIAFPLLEFLGFDRSGANGQDELLALALFFGPLPILLRLGALWVLRSEKSS
jgi:Na+/melibiose symporter-like transporter